MIPKRIFLTEAIGTAGGAALKALRDAGHEVVCFARSPVELSVEVRVGDASTLVSDGFHGERSVVHCVAHRHAKRRVGSRS